MPKRFYQTYKWAPKCKVFSCLTVAFEHTCNQFTFPHTVTTATLYMDEKSSEIASIIVYWDSRQNANWQVEVIHCWDYWIWTIALKVLSLLHWVTLILLICYSHLKCIFHSPMCLNKKCQTYFTIYEEIYSFKIWWMSFVHWCRII